jgi:hypothetical protein
MRSRSPGECGSTRSSPGGFGNIGRGFGFGESVPAQHVQEHLRVTACHVLVGAALWRLVAEVAPTVDDLLGVNRG